MLQPLFNHPCTAPNLLPTLKHSIQWEVICYLREKSVSLFIKRNYFSFPTRTFVTKLFTRSPSFHSDVQLWVEIPFYSPLFFEAEGTV